MAPKLGSKNWNFGAFCPRLAGMTEQSPDTTTVTIRHDPDRSRLFLAAFAEYFLRTCRMRTPLYDGDIDTALIADAVGLHGVLDILANDSLRAEYSSLETLVGDRQNGCTALSIATATGLPRETVRRKLKHLVENGFLIQRNNGEYAYRTGILLTEPFRELIEKLETETARFFSRCLQDGTIEITKGGNQA